MSEAPPVTTITDRSATSLALSQWSLQVLTAFAGIWIARRLGPEDFGAYALSLASIAVLATLLDLGLNPALGREAAREPARAWSLWRMSAAWRSTVGCAFALLLLGASRFTPGLGTTGALVALTPLWLARAWTSALPPLWVANGRPIRAAWSSMLPAALAAMGGALAATVDPRTTMAAFGQGGGALVGLLLVLALLLPSRVDRPSTAARPLLREGLPLMVASLATVLFLQLDLYLANAWLGREATGRYGVALRLLAFVLAWPSAWGVAQMARLARLSPRDVRMETSLETRRMAVLGLVVALALLFAAPLVPRVLGVRYAETVAPLRALAILPFFAFLAARAATALLLRGRTTRVALLVLASLALDLLLARPFAETRGTLGLALAKTVAQAAQALGFLLLFRLESIESETSVDASHPFDEAARDYDATIAAHPTLAWMRADNLAYLEERLPREGSILDLGCGSGAEVTALARHGRKITALDPSPGMLAVASGKVLAAGMDDRVTLRRGTLFDLAASERFDGAYSSLGPLNCERDLEAAARRLATLLKPGAPLIVSVMTPCCLSVAIDALLTLHWGSVVRRSGARLGARRGGQARIETTFHAPREIERAFAADFQIERIEAWPLLLPAPSIAARLPRSVFASLVKVDRRLCRLPLFVGLGDHVRVTLVRNQRPGAFGAPGRGRAGGGML